MTRELALIWAQNMDGVIGRAGQLPFDVPEDMRRFKALTFGHPCIMGRGTWDSLPDQFRPLPGRINVVLTRDLGWDTPKALVAHTPQEALDLVAQAPLVWVTGGESVFKTYLPMAHRAEVTLVDQSDPGDTHAPVLGGAWRRAGIEPDVGWATSVNGARYRFETWLNTSLS
jgi:dihydrofolate reductase